MRAPWLLAFLVPTLAAGAEVDTDATVPAWRDPHPVRVHAIGHYRMLSPRNGWTDPVPALGEQDDPAALGKANARLAKGFLDRYIDRIEAWHAAHSTPPEGLLPWLKTHPDVRRELWSAIDPRFDDAPKALAIIDTLRLKDPQKLSTYRHLAVAMAVVHDVPEATASSRRCFLWGIQEQQFSPSLEWPALWDYFTDPKNQAGMVFNPRELAWPLMTHLVDLDVSQEEITWARTTHGKGKHEVEPLYAEVPYDNGKLKRQKTALGDLPYTLANLVDRGGVCVDQAHYASRMAKIFGVPAVKCGGAGRYGGAGHSWAGYLGMDPRTHAPVLEFTGRYQFDYYYTGTAFDPQTQTEILDRHVALMYDGVTGKYETYRDASLLTRAAIALEKDQPVLSLLIVREAVQTNAYVADAWRLLMRLAVAGTLPVKDADRLYHTMLRALAKHPDLGLECLRLYQTALAKEKPDVRQRLYTEAYQVFGQAKRPDLQIAARSDQLADLAAAGRSREVLVLAFETVGANVKEGSLIMPLVKQLVELTQQFAKTVKGFRADLVKQALNKFANDFPKERGDEISPAWVEYQELVKALP